MLQRKYRGTRAASANSTELTQAEAALQAVSEKQVELEEAVARTTRLEHKKLLSEKRCKELQQQVREGEKEKQQMLEDLKQQMQLEAVNFNKS